MNYKIALYCKTYPDDFNRVVRLFESIRRHNKDKIPLYISCEAEFKGSLESKIGIEGYTYIEDESLYTATRPMAGWGIKC